MPDPSADRPLPLPEDRIQALVRSFAAGAIRQYIGTSDILGFLRDEGGIIEQFSSEEEIAPLISAISSGMNGIAEAVESGAALAPSAEHREEWNVRLPKPGGYSIVDDSMTKTWPPEPGEIRDDVAWWKEHASLDVIPVKRSVTQFGDGSWLTGPWAEVEGSQP